MPDANQQNSTSSTEENIRIKAYDLWIEEGRPDGKHDEHWHRARQSFAETDADASADAGGSETSTSTVTPIRRGRKASTASVR